MQLLRKDCPDHILCRNADHGRVREALEESLARLGLEYIDLYLMHWPQALVSETGKFQTATTYVFLLYR